MATPTLPPKYSSLPNKSAVSLIPDHFTEHAKSLISASITSASWNKHKSALNCFKAFENSSCNKHTWPLSSDSVQEFISWTLTEKSLKPSTINSYLSSISFMHNLNKMDSTNCSDLIVKIMLRGAENLNFYKVMSKGSRKVMTLPLLRLMAHQINQSDWVDNSKQVVWTAATTAFFGSFRFGELLSARETSFNPCETLMWSDLSFRSESVTVRIKIPKSRNPQGEYVDLFKIVNQNYCPVQALNRLRKLKMEDGKLEGPVFAFKTGKLLTQGSFNDTIHLLLKPHIGPAAAMITGHSFRAALPSALANRPDLANDEEIKLWGRWSSSAFKKYTRLKPAQKRSIFNKIVSSLVSL